MSNPQERYSIEDALCMGGKWDKKLDEHSWNPGIMNGTIPNFFLWLAYHARWKGYLYDIPKSFRQGSWLYRSVSTS